MNLKKVLSIFVLIIFMQSFVSAQTDTLIQEEKIIDEVLASKDTAVSQEKAEQISEITKYGFKNLFRNYTYNPAIPYTQQINPYAENYMQSYLNAHSAYLLRLQKNATPYFNLIDGILTQYGLPHELKYLAVIESDLKSNALSHAGASGPWQFMDYTARDYGLKVDNQVDERTDYTKSTHAASKYLLNLYKDLNDWLLVIAAYNGGPGRVYSAIKKSGSRDFWKLQYYLPEESRNHVKKFIATHFVMENGNGGEGSIFAKKQKEVEIPDSLKKDLTSLTISGRFLASVIAESVDLSQKEFDVLNPQMDNVLLTGSEFKLQLPAEKMKIFEEKRFDILNKSVQILLDEAQQDSKTAFDKKKSN